LRNLGCDRLFLSNLQQAISNLSIFKMNPQINPKNSPLETVHVDSKKVSCDGGKGTSDHSLAGHPLVYLNMGKNDFVVCPYCSKYFTTEKKTAVNSVIFGIKNQMKDE
jgi:uncharacterized Zn-finger protein